MVAPGDGGWVEGESGTPSQVMGGGCPLGGLRARPAGLPPLSLPPILLWGSLGHGLAAEGSSQLGGQLLAGTFPFLLPWGQEEDGGTSATHAGS